jgi:hypothetical protein
MRTIDIDVDDEIEELVPRPTPGDDLREEVESVLDGASDLLEEYDTGQHRTDTDRMKRTPGDTPGGDRRQTDTPGGDRRQTDTTGGDRTWNRTAENGEFTDAWERPDAGQDSAERDRSRRDENGGGGGSSGAAGGEGARPDEHPGRSDVDGTGTDTDRRDESDGITRVPSPEPPADRDDEEDRR